MKLTSRISKLSKRAKTAGKKGSKKAGDFLKSKEGQALLKAVLIALPLILNALPQTKKIKMAKKVISKIF